MQTLKPILYFCAILILVGCKKVDKVQFNMDFNDPVTLPSSTAAHTPIDLYAMDIPTNSLDIFSENNTASDKIESITLSSLDLTVTSPDGADFSFMETVTIFISGANLPEIQLANKSGISDIATELYMETATGDFQAYLKNDKVNFRVNCETDDLTPIDYVINVHPVFAVNAEVID